MTRVLWPELGDDAAAAGWLVDFPPVASDQVLDAVSRRHPMDGFNGVPGRWVFAREVQAATGSYSDTQRFDAVAIGLVPSVKYARVVYEVKVSRADWLRELRPLIELRNNRYGTSFRARRSAELLKEVRAGTFEPLPGEQVVETHKWDAALAVSTEYWVAAPPRCVLVTELPPEAGLLEVRPWGASGELRARVVRPAPVRDTPNPDPAFWAAVLRRAAGVSR